jgi:tRNA (cytidine/uridine-2'-O-)-methyltransferase
MDVDPSMPEFGTSVCLKRLNVNDPLCEMAPSMANPTSPFVSTPDATERHVVLVAPEVHWNTGNIGRTCLGAEATLHLIRPLGFSLSDRHLRRAGLDYWPRVDLQVWDDQDAFFEAMTPAEDEVSLLSKTGGRSFRHLPDPDRLFLIFGSETRGLPPALFHRFPDARYHIPISAQIRSLNLSTAVGIVLFESLRRRPRPHGWPVV